MRPNETHQDDRWLELSDAAPRSITRLLQRLAVRDPEITGQRAQALLEAVGFQVSRATCSSVLSEARTVIGYMEKNNLVCKNFEQRRGRVASDFFEMQRRRRRRRD